MRLLNIESGPWGGFILVMTLLASAFVLYFASWFVSGLLAVAVIVVPIALVTYIFGRRIMRRLVHGKGAS